MSHIAFVHGCEPMLPKCRTSCFLPFGEMLLKCRTSMRMLSIRCYLNVVLRRDIDW